MDSNKSVKSFFSSDDWKFSPSRERNIVLSRFCNSEDLIKIGNEMDIGWFSSVEEVSYSEEKKARDLIVKRISNVEVFQDILNLIKPIDTWNFSWFSGFHYNVEFGENISVKKGPKMERWKNVFENVENILNENPELYLILQGIVSNGVSYSHYFRTDLSAVISNQSKKIGTQNSFSVEKAKKPKEIPGIKSINTQNGLKYRVAIEILPVLKKSLKKQDISTQSLKKNNKEKNGLDSSNRLTTKSPTFKHLLNSIRVRYEDIREFKSIIKEYEALEYWKDYIAPMIRFRDDAKKAVLCMLASPCDKNGTKGRTNAIFFGPPGTGKSAFKDFIVTEFGAYSIDGARVSKADLTYNKKTDEKGLLVRAHKGLSVIEEADEMNENALGAALTSFGESGIIEIRDMRLPAEVRGIMIGNYRNRKEIIDRHGESLFNRFEFVIHFDNLTEEKKDTAINYQYEYFRKPKSPTDTKKLKKYLSWIRNFEPSIPDRELELIKKYKSKRIDDFENVRQGISIMNVAYTIARLNHRDLTLEDYKKAFDLVR